MQILIIEDEPHAVQRLQSLIRELMADADIVGKIDSVKKAVDWFKKNDPPDVVLMDIQLADGISFQIFEQYEVKAPVIFTTAYEEYALKAFKVNSIDYILKPVDREELDIALKKVSSRQRSANTTAQLLQNMSEAVKMLTKKYKARFMIKVGEHLRTIEVDNIRFFHSQDKTTFCVTGENRSLIVDYTLEQLEEMLNPLSFYRINRKYLVSAAAIQDIINYTNSRLRLVLKGSQDNDIIVARERVQDFKNWLDK
ncbi:MAG: LytTR family DNA-binding domain-containing protein [Cyclobacteriaceae bacterium]